MLINAYIEVTRLIEGFKVHVCISNPKVRRHASVYRTGLGTKKILQTSDVVTISKVRLTYVIVSSFKMCSFQCIVEPRGLGRGRLHCPHADCRDVEIVRRLFAISHCALRLDAWHFPNNGNAMHRATVASRRRP